MAVRLLIYTMSSQENNFTMNFTPTKNKIPNQIKLITSPPAKLQLGLMQELLNSPIQKQLFVNQSRNDSQEPLDSSESDYQDSHSDLIELEHPEEVIGNDEIVESQNAHVLFTPNKMEKGCNCEKSKCAKKYCECYKVGRVCSESCKCVGCENMQITENHEQLKVLTQMTKSGKGGRQITCKCRKSHCLKNYCECHNAGKYCSQACNCLQCENLIQKNGRKRKASENISMWNYKDKENFMLN